MCTKPLSVRQQMPEHSEFRDLEELEREETQCACENVGTAWVGRKGWLAVGLSDMLEG